MPAVEERSTGCFVLAPVLCASALAAPYGKTREKYARPGGATGAPGPGLGDQTGLSLKPGNKPTPAAVQTAGQAILRTEIVQ